MLEIINYRMRDQGKARIGSEEVTKFLFFCDEWRMYPPHLLLSHSLLLFSDIPVNKEIKKKRCRARSSKPTLELPSPAAKETDWRVHCQERGSMFAVLLFTKALEIAMSLSKCSWPHSLVQIPSCLCSDLVIELSCLLFLFKSQNLHQQIFKVS